MPSQPYVLDPHAPANPAEYMVRAIAQSLHMTQLTPGQRVDVLLSALLSELVDLPPKNRDEIAAEIARDVCGWVTSGADAMATAVLTDATPMGSA